MFWLFVTWAAIAFGAAFGALCVFAGARRVLRAGTEKRPGEARVWGTVGVLAGAALLTYAAWLAWGRIVPRA